MHRNEVRGDVTLDGADLEEDMSYCAERMRDLGLPFLAIPGNHDVNIVDRANPSRLELPTARGSPANPAGTPAPGAYF